jgi:hypothetical protein
MEPIRHRLSVSCSSERAFDAFTSGMGRWWDPHYTPDPGTFSGVDVEPRVGGTVALRHRDTAYPFGEVTAWEPGEHYAQTFTLAMDRTHPSALDVRFESEENGCRIEFEHGGWDADNASARQKYGDWPHLLGRFVRFAETDG